MNAYRVFYKKQKGDQPPFKYVYITAASDKIAKSIFKNDKKYEKLIVECVKPV